MKFCAKEHDSIFYGEWSTECPLCRAKIFATYLKQQVKVLEKRLTELDLEEGERQLVKNDVLEKVRREAIEAVSIPESLKQDYIVVKKSDRIILIPKRK